MGTYKYYKKNFTLLSKALKHLEYKNDEDLNDKFFKDIYDYLLNYTSKKNSKINDTVSCMITILNFYSIRYPKRYKLLDDTEHFKVLKTTEYNLPIDFIDKLDLSIKNNISYSLAIRLSLESGVRLSELLNIKVKNIDIETESILLDQTKNGEKRFVFYGKLSRDLIRIIAKNEVEYLINDYNNDKRMTHFMIFHFYDYLNDSISHETRITSHRLRKTYVTKLATKGCPITTIQKLLGHKDIRQTIKYIELDNIILKRDYVEFYPY